LLGAGNRILYQSKHETALAAFNIGRQHATDFIIRKSAAREWPLGAILIPRGVVSGE
jgi:hypothetical protein